MQKTKTFKSGNSMAVRIPKSFTADAEEVDIFKRGDELLIRKSPQNLGEALKSLGQRSNDFMEEGRADEPPQDRHF